MLHVNNLSFTYPDGRVALSAVNVTIASGESVAIMGENGAGKTTLIKHLNGLLLPTSGRVLVDGIDTRQARVSDLARKVGLVFQNPYQQLFAQTVAEEITLGVRANHGGSAADASSLVQEMLHTFHLLGLEQRHPLSLSEGERKRLALAAVLATNPSILVLDEPTLGQDGRERATLETVVSRVREQGKTVIVITHDIDFACACCQRIVLMRGGSILADGPAQEIARRRDLLQQVGLVPPQLVDLAQHLTPWQIGDLPVSRPGLAQAIVSAIEQRRYGTAHSVQPRCLAADASLLSLSSRTGAAAPSSTPIACSASAYGPVSGMDARSKIAAALLIFAALTIAGHPLALALIAIALITVTTLDHLLASWLRVILTLLPVVVLVGAMDMIYFGPLHGLFVAVRFILVVSLFAIFFLTTSLDDLSAALTSWGLPYPLVFALVTGARFAPTVSLEARDIVDAYQARGVDHARGVIGWFRRYSRILIPLVAATIRRSLRLGEAMEMRGFGKTNRPTALRDLTWRAGESVLTAGAVTLFVLSILL